MSNNLMAMTLSINALLADIYGTEKRVSGILLDLGLEQSHIDELKDEKLASFYDNIKFALECRFLHYSGGHKLLNILYRRYGLFGGKKETLEEIGDSIGVSRERVRQLQNKAIKRMLGGVSADATGILLLLCACNVLGLDAMGYITDKEIIKNSPSESAGDISNETDERNYDGESEGIPKQVKPLDLPKAAFYISGGFDYGSGRGKYRMLMECGEYKKYIEKQDIEGHSDVNMILLAVIEGLEMLRKPFDVTVFSNALFGISSLYKHGELRQEVPSKASNYELKEKIRRILKERRHYLTNIADNDIKVKIASYTIPETSNSTQ